MIIPRDERERLELVLEEFDEAMDLGLVLETQIRKHPSINEKFCAGIRFSKKISVDKAQAALKRIIEKYTTEYQQVHVGQQSHEFVVWFEQISRILKAEYTMEIAQDLQAVHGLDAHEELANILSKEILEEVNKEVIRSIYPEAKSNLNENT